MRVSLKASLAVALFSLVAGDLRAEVALPESFAGWKSVRVSRVGPEDFERLAGAEAPVLREYGAVGGERREFVSGARRLVATLYRFRDSSGAYGMFTFGRTAAMQPIQIAGPRISGAAAEDTRLLAAFGNHVVEIQGEGLRGVVEIELREMIGRLAQSAGDAGPLPTLPTHLPKVGLLVNSDRYVLGTAALERIRPMNLGDWVGFAFSAEVELGRYQLGEQTPTLLLLLYPTPQIAAERSKEFARYFVVNEETPQSNLPPAFLKRTGPLVALVLDTNSSSVASFLLDRIDYRWEVTWSERASAKDEPSMVQIVVGVLVGAGLFLLVCLLISVAFGGFRILITRLLPGKIFDRPSATEIIQLHLEQKEVVKNQ